MRIRRRTRWDAREPRRTWSSPRRTTRWSVDMKTTDRREFLLRAGALSAGGLVQRLVPVAGLGLAQSALAQTAPSDYKALVCVFLFGGADGNNLVVPQDS